MSLFYLSFINPDLPAVGHRHVGSTIVKAESASQAAMEAKRLNLFPKGNNNQIAVVELHAQEEPYEAIEEVEQLPPEARPMFERFVSSKDIEALAPTRSIDEDDCPTYISSDHF